MTLRVSTKFKEQILGPVSFAAIFNMGKIEVYSGAQPANPDFAPTGTLLATVTNNGDTWVAGSSAGGLTFTQYGAFVAIGFGQNWRMKATVSGTAGWFRLVGSTTDPGQLSYSHPRLDGSIAATGSSQIILATTSLTAGDNIAVQQFTYTILPIS